MVERCRDSINSIVVSCTYVDLSILRAFKLLQIVCYSFNITIVWFNRKVAQHDVYARKSQIIFRIIEFSVNVRETENVSYISQTWS